MQIKITSITPTGAFKRYKNVVPGKILNALRAEQKNIKKELDKTTETWEGEKPGWIYKSGIHLSSGNAEASVTCNPNNDYGAQKWEWLNGGTAWRWSMMRKGFTPKTRPGWFGSGPGGPRAPAFIGEGAFTERGLPANPGIEAREWDIEIATVRQEAFADAVQEAITGELEKEMGKWRNK